MRSAGCIYFRLSHLQTTSTMLTTATTPSPSPSQISQLRPNLQSTRINELPASPLQGYVQSYNWQSHTEVERRIGSLSSLSQHRYQRSNNCGECTKPAGVSKCTVGLPSESPGHSISSFPGPKFRCPRGFQMRLANVGLTRGKFVARVSVSPGGYGAPLKYTVRSLHAHVLRSPGG